MYTRESPTCPIRYCESCSSKTHTVVPIPCLSTSVSDDEEPVREVREKTVLVPRADHSGMSALTYLELHACPINVRGELRQSPPPRLPRSRTAATTADAG